MTVLQGWKEGIDGKAKVIGEWIFLPFDRSTVFHLRIWL
jgi:hypothetical protein